ncbi:enoyl-CoA hydratase-related protein [Amaricoccus sp.]|uniref:enoyl-CoA hydratase-related protein n=1 Tax=Amaricoccus sp. TaxID=1872485 RepID=UPI001B54FFCC|nr:enoyl-CoA hydratase-related protein [Amaricoccus sp.]MBP7243071.1 enoyl-CoA hydratase/isomerase family protein [Amaricoccus sp.]
MSYETIHFAVEAGVATLTLARADKLNALNEPMRREITAAVGRAGAEARVLVLTGEGRAFCTGQDLGVAGADFDVGRILREEYEPMLRAIYDCPVPTIAAVNGVAAGAGANLALGCDVAIAAESAVFIQAFARIGLVPDAGGTWWLPRQVGFARAMGAALFAEPVPARQAADWGMIWQAVPDAEFAEVVRARARRLADGPTAAYRLMKQALRRGLASDLETQLALEAELQAQAGATRDFREALTAFLEKRPPRYEGR